MESTYLNVSPKTPLTNDASSTSRKSTCKNSCHPTDNNELDLSNCDFTSFDHISGTNREDKIKDKGFWKNLKNKLKPKKKEKSNFVGHVEPSDRQNYNQDHTTSYNVVHCHNPKYESHFVDYNFVSTQNRMFFKDNKFRASTIDSRRLYKKNLSGQMFVRSKREAKLVVTNKNFNTRLLYLGDGTAERIDQWLAENEAFKRNEENQCAIATAVVGSHRRSSQPTHAVNQTPKQSRKYEMKTPESSKHAAHITPKQQINSHSIQGSISTQPPDTTITNLFRQSSRSVNHLPISRNKTGTNKKNRPSSHHENHDILSNETTKQMQQFEPVCASDRRSISRNKVDTNVTELTKISANENSTTRKPKSTQKPGTTSLEKETSCTAEVVSTSSCLTRNSAELQKLNKISKSKCSEFETIDKEVNMPPQIRDDSVRSKMSSLSSESLKSLSCDESYCTDYTPFEEEIKNLNKSSFRVDQIKSGTPFSNKSEPNIDNILPVGLKNKIITKSKIPVESLLMRREIFYRDRPKLYKTPQVAKFVTTIFLTGDEISTDRLPINDSFNKTNHQRDHDKITHQSSAFREQQAAEKRSKNIFQASQIVLNTSETKPIDMGKQVPSNIYLTNKGTEIYPISPHKFDVKKNEDFHLDIDIFDYKTKNKEHEIDAHRHNSAKVIQHSEENVLLPNVLLKKENFLFTNAVGTLEDFESSCTQKISEIEIPKSPNLKNVTSINKIFPMKESLKEDNFQTRSQLNESTDLHILESNNEFLAPKDRTDESLADVTLFSDHEEETDEKSQITNKNSEDESFDDVFDGTTSPCQINFKDEISLTRKITQAKVPDNERHSPPLNSFTSRSSFSMFDEMSDSSAESPSDSMKSPLLHDFKDINDVSNDKETQSYSFDKSISPTNDTIQFDKNKTKKPVEDPNLDLRAFMSVKHNDHARIFDLCFGNSPSLSKTSPEGTEILEDAQTSGWKDMDYASKNDKNAQLLSTRYIKNSNHASNLHTFNHTEAFYV